MSRGVYVIELLLLNGRMVLFDEDPQPSIAKAAALGRELARKRLNMTHAVAARAVIIRDGRGGAVHREDVEHFLGGMPDAQAP